MSRTLFFYIFKDLLRIFFLCSGALAGIMSFGGLLRPLTEHGLNAPQAAKMLSYFMPAMTTYSLPIAALFATTVVYGRLAADNELVACRAAGISYPSIGMPALVLGLTVALVSLLFLCFIVPVFTLKVEKVIYSNLAQLISNQIERTHQIKFQDTTIFAQEASVAEGDPRNPDEQMVRLGGIMIVAYDRVDASTPDSPKLQVPKEFYLAKEARVFIRRARNDQFTLEAQLERGAMFPRRFSDGQGMQGGVEQTQFGPMVIDSLIREETKFMDIRRLHELYRDLEQSRKVQEQMGRITRAIQEQHYLAEIAQALSKPGGTFHFRAGAGREQYDLISPRGSVGTRNNRLVITPARLVQLRDGKADFTWDAAEVELTARPVADEQLSVQAALRDVKAQTPEGPTAITSFARHFGVAMPPALRRHETRGLEDYQTAPDVLPEHRATLKREVIRLGNGIQSEMHSRASFAVSCLILVVVGCALGMMFKSGNFLTAFALSVVPALVCIALIVAGQHTCENVPWKLEGFQNPINLGIGLIWSGNALVLALAAALWSRLARQ
ncbi:MAG TPA: LptF/LptG family permease [Tepidisphaeraceae bacterium]|nr:LptF/LptG family permease [Tepidisphaeraceae bacterium]